MTRTHHNEAGVVIAALKHLGVDPRAAADSPMMQLLIIQWTKGEIDNAQFKKCCENMLIFNPSLKVSL